MDIEPFNIDLDVMSLPDENKETLGTSRRKMVLLALKSKEQRPSPKEGTGGEWVMLKEAMWWGMVCGEVEGAGPQAGAMPAACCGAGARVGRGSS